MEWILLPLALIVLVVGLALDFKGLHKRVQMDEEKNGNDHN